MNRAGGSLFFQNQVRRFLQLDGNFLGGLNEASEIGRDSDDVFLLASQKRCFNLNLGSKFFPRSG